MVERLEFEAVAEHVTFRLFIRIAFFDEHLYINRSHIREAVVLTFLLRAYRDCKRQWVGALFILSMVVTQTYGRLQNVRKPKGRRANLGSCERKTGFGESAGSCIIWRFCRSNENMNVASQCNS